MRAGIFVCFVYQCIQVSGIVPSETETVQLRLGLEPMVGTRTQPKPRLGLEPMVF